MWTILRSLFLNNDYLNVIWVILGIVYNRPDISACVCVCVRVCVWLKGLKSS